MSNDSAIFSPEQVNLNMKSNTKDEAIQELTELLHENGFLYEKHAFMEAVKKREEEYSTGIGYGVAIPHGKSPAVKKAGIIFGRCENGLDYDSMDQKPVSLFILIAVPDQSSDLHLKILSNLSRKLMHEDFRQRLQTADTATEIVDILNI